MVSPPAGRGNAQPCEFCRIERHDPRFHAAEQGLGEPAGAGRSPDVTGSLGYAIDERRGLLGDGRMGHRGYGRRTRESPLRRIPRQENSERFDEAPSRSAAGRSGEERPVTYEVCQRPLPNLSRSGALFRTAGCRPLLPEGGVSTRWSTDGPGSARQAGPASTPLRLAPGAGVFGGAGEGDFGKRQAVGLAVLVQQRDVALRNVRAVGKVQSLLHAGDGRFIRALDLDE